MFIVGALDQSAPELIVEAYVLPFPSDPVYLMLFPSLRAARQMRHTAERLSVMHGLSGRPIEMPRLHVTLMRLCCFGALLPETYRAVCVAAASIAMPRFLASLDWAASFGNGSRRPLVLRGYDTVAGITLLQSELAAALRCAGFGEVGAVATPHVTLLYANRGIADQAVPEIRWQVRAFTLICSLEGRHRYLKLGAWPLRG